MSIELDLNIRLKTESTNVPLVPGLSLGMKCNAGSATGGVGLAVRSNAEPWNEDTSYTFNL